jgi:hypothetical protein
MTGWRPGSSRQGCWRNEGSIEVEASALTSLFCDSYSNLEINEAFQISHKLCLDLAEKFSKNELERSIDFEVYSILLGAHEL